MDRSASPDVLVVGGGPAGLAAALSAAEYGANVLLVERDERLGGILPQCIHDGFGIEMFDASLTGPEYADRLVTQLSDTHVGRMTNTSVMSIQSNRVCWILGPDGYRALRPDAIVLAMGCRERAFGTLAIPGPRPAGIYSAGTAQRLMNLDGLMVGHRAVVLGSGDIGLIMARRMTLSGASAACVVERLPYASGLPRNIVQCLNDYEIPLLLRHTVVEVLGDARLEGVIIAEVDSAGCAVDSTRRLIECDTLLVSVGLIPENELSRSADVAIDHRTSGATVDQNLMTSIPGVFACGNALHVHDVADWASIEGRGAGLAAARWSQGDRATESTINVVAGHRMRYALPQRIAPGTPCDVSFRVTEPIRGGEVSVAAEGVEIMRCTFDHLEPSTLQKVSIPALENNVRTVELQLD